MFHYAIVNLDGSCIDLFIGGAGTLLGYMQLRWSAVAMPSRILHSPLTQPIPFGREAR